MTGPIVYELKFSVGICFFWHETEERKKDKFPFQLKYEVLMVVNMKSLFWNAVLHCLMNRYWYCRGNYCLHLRVDEFTKMHSVLIGDHHHLTLWSLFNKLRNLPDMTWNKYFLQTEFLAAHVICTLPFSTPHYATLHLYFLSVKILEISTWTVSWILFSALTTAVRLPSFSMRNMDNKEVILILTSIPIYHWQHILIIIIAHTAEVLLHAQHVLSFQPSSVA